MIIDEGYIKFSLEMHNGPAPTHPQLSSLIGARQELFERTLIGLYPNGIGYGNVSLRTEGTQFIITGSATGGIPVLHTEHFCLVKDFDLAMNSVIAVGPIHASSESMTHGAVYAANEQVQSVMHIHSRHLFDTMLAHDHPHTPVEAAFGTPDLALAIADLVKRRDADSGIFVTAGHDEGIIAYGRSIEETLALILHLAETVK